MSEPTKTTLNYEITVTIRDGYDAATVQAAVEEATSIAGWGIPARLLADVVKDVPGVLDAEIVTDEVGS